MRAVLKAIGPFTLRPQRDRFAVLVRSIVSQQISTAAAATILGRLQDLFPDRAITATRLLETPVEDLRSRGLSARKVEYLTDLASKVDRQELDLTRIGRCSDEGIIEQLVEVKGIGRWTAQMFLIFSLGRLDVVAPDDLGLRAAMKSLYGLEELPDRARFEAIAEPWRPYASVASWYCWRAIERRLDRDSLGLG